jgi:hypothetical protein
MTNEGENLIGTIPRIGKSTVGLVRAVGERVLAEAQLASAEAHLAEMNAVQSALADMNDPKGSITTVYMTDVERVAEQLGQDGISQMFCPSGPDLIPLTVNQWQIDGRPNGTSLYLLVRGGCPELNGEDLIRALYPLGKRLLTNSLQTIMRREGQVEAVQSILEYNAYAQACNRRNSLL